MFLYEKTASWVGFPGALLVSQLMASPPPAPELSTLSDQWGTEARSSWVLRRVIRPPRNLGCLEDAGIAVGAQSVTIFLEALPVQLVQSTSWYCSPP